MWKSCPSEVLTGIVRFEILTDIDYLSDYGFFPADNSLRTGKRNFGARGRGFLNKVWSPLFLLIAGIGYPAKGS